MIEHLSDFPSNVVAFLSKDHVTRRDYETVLVPVVEAALEQHEKVRLYYQIDLDFSGVERGVAQNFKIGMGHLLRWDRIAIVTDVDWIRYTLRTFGLLNAGSSRNLFA